MRGVILVDGSNLYASAKQLRRQIDYSKIDKITNIPILRKYYFTAVLPRDIQNNLVGVTDWLSYNGWVVVSKAAKMFTDDKTGEDKVKGNMDIEIAVKAMKVVDFPGITDVFLFSGDGDFRCLVEAIQDRGIRVTVISLQQDRRAGIQGTLADELRRQADVYYDITSLDLF